MCFLQVARLQVQVLENLKQLRIRTDRVKEAVRQLNEGLLDVTQLYTDFAEELGLPECKLAIVHCAGHSDPVLMETLWTEIIDRGMSSRFLHSLRAY